MFAADAIDAYLPVFIFLALAFVVSAGLLAAPFLLAPHRPDRRKLASYECGFEPFDDARMPFNIRFYLVALLFILFDLEIAFLFPWALTLDSLGAFGFWSMALFLGVLTVGFIYEWRKGALEWD